MAATPAGDPMRSPVDEVLASLGRSRSATTSPRSLWIRVTSDSQAAETIRRLQSAAARSGWPILTADCEQPLPVAFSAARGLLEPLVPLLEEEAPDLLSDYAPELLRLMPRLRDHRLLQDAPELDEIALGGTKRRLHKESEKLFRIVYAFATIVLSAQRRCSRFKEHVLCVAVQNVEAADRLSLSCLYHLVQRADPARLQVLLIGQEPQPLGGPWLWDIPGDTCRLSLEPARLHQRLLHRFIAGLRPEIVDLPRSSAVVERVEMPRSPEHRKQLLMRLVGAPEAVLRTTSQRPELASLPYPGRRVAQALYEDLPQEVRQTLHAAIVTRLGRDGTEHREPVEELAVHLAFHTLRAGRIERGVELAANAARDLFGFSQNYESIAYLCHAILEALDGRPHLAGYGTVARLLLGLTHSYIGDQERAMELLGEAYEATGDSTLRGQICYYSGLILAKRLARLDEAETRFRHGLAVLGATDTAAARLEKGWLLNGRAFISWQRGDLPLARAQVEESLRQARGLEGLQARNLEVNLINNLSLLYEVGGDLGTALATWEELEAVAAAAPGTAGKSYHYRRGWLLLADGRLGDAAEAYRVAFALAAEVRDRFHMDLISRSCSYVACRRRLYDEAFDWLRRNYHLQDALGDASGAALSQAQLGHAAIQAMDHPLAKEAFAAAARTARQARVEPLASRLLAALAQLEHDRQLPSLQAESDFHGIQLARPQAKLTTPFLIADLSSEESFAPWAHRSLWMPKPGAIPAERGDR